MWCIALLLLAGAFALPEPACAEVVAVTMGAGAAGKTASASGDAGLAAVDQLATGRRIYREGVLPDGRLLVGLAQAGVVRSGADAACAACHRRSGYGGGEGALSIRSITGPALFGTRDVRPTLGGADTSRSPATAGASPTGAAAAAQANAASLREVRAAAFRGSRQQPPYDNVLLGRSLRDGLDATGRPLHAAMPRYALDDDALAALTAYLKTLSVHAAPGVTADAIHFATVIQPNVDPARRRAMLDVLNAFFADRNAGIRAELRRERTGNVHLGRVTRIWVLHVWDLSGAPETWTRQLDARYRDQPVFALIGGLGESSWQPIHAFSERFEVPCLFPQTDLPVQEGPGFYTVYRSRGVALEAEVLARFLLERKLPTAGLQRVVLVSRRSGTDAAGVSAAAGVGGSAGVAGSVGAVGAVGAAVFRAAWLAGGGAAPVEHVVDDTPDRTFWEGIAAQPGASVVLWLSPADLVAAGALLDRGAQIEGVYLAHTLRAGTVAGLRRGSEAQVPVRIVSTLRESGARGAGEHLVAAWLASRGINVTEDQAQAQVQADAFLAATALAGAMAHDTDTRSRELLLERIEHLVGNGVDQPLYPHVSLGPGQRFAVKGAHVLQLASRSDGPPTVASRWIVP